MIVGAGTTGRLVERKLAAHPEYGLEVVGFVDDDPRTAAAVLGTTAELTRIVDELDVDCVILAASHGEVSEALLERVRAVRRPDVHLSIVPTYFELFASNATIEELEGVPMVSLPPMRLSRSRRALKRTFDLVVAAAALSCSRPSWSSWPSLVKLDSAGPGALPPGPQRPRRRALPDREVPHDGRRRRGPALRRWPSSTSSTRPALQDPLTTRASPVSGASCASLEPRRAPAAVERRPGRDVARRPAARSSCTRPDQITGWAGRRLETTPGITGLWQVLGRNDIPFDEMVKLDYVYVTNWSLWWDMKILFQTLPVVLARRGAY